MKRLLLISLALAALGMQSQAAWINQSISGSENFYNNGFIPDGNFSGLASTMTLNDTGLVGSGGVQVTLNISGGWNGDLFGYLVHDSGYALLLDRTGSAPSSPYGFSNSGFEVVLADSSSTSISSVGSYSSLDSITGTYKSQGTSLDGVGGSFYNTSISGEWTLFLADMSFGDQSQLTGWSLSIDAVPEPSTWAMIIFGVAFGGWQLWSWRMKRC
jgi:subtilisin-like proprotein convertase family protein